MGERIKGCMPRSYWLDIDMTMCSGEGCYGMERKGRWWQLFTTRQTCSVAALATFSFTAQEAEEEGGQKGVTAVVDLCYSRPLP